MENRRTLTLLSLFLVLVLGACSQTPIPVDDLTPTPAEDSDQTPEPSVPATESPRGSLTLSVWLPPEFDPNSGSAAGDLMRARLEAFRALNPDLSIDIRVKAEDGPGGLLPSLTAAHAAAPLALPDLIALPQSDLEAAAIKNLVHPIDGLSNVHESDDWYQYARDLVHIQDSNFGFAFAGNALVLVYRPSAFDQPPVSIAQAIELGEALAFPAASADSLTTLNLYLAHGGQIEDEDGRPFLDAQSLESALGYFESGLQSGTTPFWLTQFESFSQSEEAFTNGQANLAIAWSEDYFAAMRDDSAAVPLPGPEGVSGTLATGWIWAVTSEDPIHLEAAISLAEFLVDPEFLGVWTEAAGVLPTRPSSLQEWDPSPERVLVGEVAQSARAVPSNSLLAILGPALQAATVDILKQLSDPQSAAQQAADALAPEGF